MYEKYMIEAIKEAEIAYSLGEVPVGAVLVCNDKIIARSHNTKDFDHCVLGHAEVNVIRESCHILDDWRIKNATLYVTLLPCPMCASAINQARIDKVVCGTVPNNVDYDLIYKILSDNNYGSKVRIITGVMEEECAQMLQKFFLQKRH